MKNKIANKFKIDFEINNFANYYIPKLYGNAFTEYEIKLTAIPFKNSEYDIIYFSELNIMIKNSHFLNPENTLRKLVFDDDHRTCYLTLSTEGAKVDYLHSSYKKGKFVSFDLQITTEDIKSPFILRIEINTINSKTCQALTITGKECKNIKKYGNFCGMHS